jgi:hypothetical protein
MNKGERVMNKDKAWYLVFMFFMLAGEADENIINLMSSDTFDSDFDNLIQNFEIMDSDEFKQRSIDALKDKKDMLKDMNMAYIQSYGWQE